MHIKNHLINIIHKWTLRIKTNKASGETYEKKKSVLQL